MDLHRSVIGLSMTAVVLACAASANARTGPVEPALAAAAPAGIAGRIDPAARRAFEQAQIAEAVGYLEQAALQWSFASNAEELALLQKAKDRLVAAVKQLQGSQRVRTADLLADLNHAIERASTHLGTLDSPSGEMFGPRAPDRDQLAQLATEGQDLERGAPFPHRLLDTVGAGSARHALPAHAQIEQADIALSNSDLQSWPPGGQVQWPQIRVEF